VERGAKVATPTAAQDLTALRAQLASLATDGRLDEALDLVLTLLGQLRDRNTKLELDVARLLRKHLGQTSERVSTAQLNLLLGLLPDGAAGAAADADGDGPLPPTGAELPARDKPKRKGHGRRALPAHLPRVEVLHAVEEEERICASCGAPRTCIGHETSEVLEFVPASWRVEQHKREKLACRRCDEGVTVAPAPDKVIEKGLPGPGLLAHVVVSKYADHLPLNRQHKMFLRDGVDLAPSTLADWVAAVHRSIEPLCARIRALALLGHVLHADDTGIKVLDKDAPGGARRGHLWCYASDGMWAAFVYTTDWRKEGPQSYLASRRGWLVADAYKGYDGLFTRKDATAVEVGCWAHGRRPFAELALGGADARAAIVLGKIRKLYEIEALATADAVYPPGEPHLPALTPAG